MQKDKLIIGSLIILFLISIFFGLFQHAPIKNTSKSTPLIPIKDGIAVIYIYGPLMVNLNSPFSANPGIDAIIEQLKRIEKDKRVKALVLRVNSPGGTPGASQELYNEIVNFKQRVKIPVVVSIADIGASGAYWVSMAGDTIFANPSAIIGSIGVIVQNFDFSEIKEKYGIGMNTVKTAKYKDILSPWNKITEDNKAFIQSLLENIHEQFVDTLIFARKLDTKTAHALANGKIYTGEQAVKLGLIDELGGMQDAIKFAATRAGIKGDPKIISKPVSPVQQFLQFWKNNVGTYISTSKESLFAPILR
jgi:protease IV